MLHAAVDQVMVKVAVNAEQTATFCDEPATNATVDISKSIVESF